MTCPSVFPDVGADLLAMCQRNIALNSHLTAAGGEAQQVPAREGGFPVSQVRQTPRTTTLGGGVLPASLDTPVAEGADVSASYHFRCLTALSSPHLLPRPQPRPTSALSSLQVAGPCLVSPAPV